MPSQEIGLYIDTTTNSNKPAEFLENGSIREYSGGFLYNDHKPIEIKKNIKMSFSNWLKWYKIIFN